MMQGIIGHGKRTICFSDMHQWKRYPIQKMLKRKNDKIYDKCIYMIYRIISLKGSDQVLLQLGLFMSIVWNSINEAQIIQTHSDVLKLTKNVLFGFAVFCFCSLIMNPMIAYLEKQLLSFMFKKLKSRITIDDKNDPYRPVKHIDLCEMKDLV